MLIFSGDLSLHVDLRYKCLGFHDAQGHIKLTYHAKSLCGHEVKDWSLRGREDGSVEKDLLHKSEDGVEVSRTNTSVGCGEVETGDAQSSLASQFSQSVRSRLSRRPCLKKYSGEKQWSKTLMCFLKTFY